MPAHRGTIVIIGGGFSGTMTAAHLLRNPAAGPLRIAMVNRSGRLARGVAYGTRSSAHVLNVPAGRMSAFEDDPDDFLRFVRRRDAAVTGGTFVARSLYGEYLEHVLLSSQAASAPGTTFEHVADEATGIHSLGDGRRVRVLLANAPPLDADRVVLAVGNYTPANPPLADPTFFESDRYVRDPWSVRALDRVALDRPVLLIGTGLTMIDVALHLGERGCRASMLAISRRGVIAQPHRAHGSPPSYGHLPPELLACEASASSYLRAVRRHIRSLAAEGVDWRDVVASLRPVTPRLWERLSHDERMRFLRHVRPYWDAHRHRVAPALWSAIEALMAADRLSIRAARLVAAQERNGGVCVELRARGHSRAETMEVGTVVNCIGPSSDIRQLRDRLIEDLLHSGTAVADAEGLGLVITDDLALVDRRGHASSTVSLVGPLLKGRYWEATAVPELRAHAGRLAARLASELSRAPARLTA